MKYNIDLDRQPLLNLYGICPQLFHCIRVNKLTTLLEELNRESQHLLHESQTVVDPQELGSMIQEATNLRKQAAEYAELGRTSFEYARVFREHQLN